MVLVLRVDDDCTDTEYYCVECCVKNGSISPVPRCIVQEYLNEIVDHAFDDVHRAREITIRKANSIGEVGRIVGNRARALAAWGGA